MAVVFHTSRSGTQSKPLFPRFPGFAPQSKDFVPFPEVSLVLVLTVSQTFGMPACGCHAVLRMRMLRCFICPSRLGLLLGTCHPISSSFPSLRLDSDPFLRNITVAADPATVRVNAPALGIFADSKSTVTVRFLPLSSDFHSDPTPRSTCPPTRPATGLPTDQRLRHDTLLNSPARRLENVH